MINAIKGALTSTFATVAIGFVAMNVAGHFTAAKMDDTNFSGISYGANDTNIPEAVSTLTGLVTCSVFGLGLGARNQRKKSTPAPKPSLD
jgi:hypothetical protein